MWNNWVGQLQDTLGEAVEYLREDDEEEEDEEILDDVPQNESDGANVATPSLAAMEPNDNPLGTSSWMSPALSLGSAVEGLGETSVVTSITDFGERTAQDSGPRGSATTADAGDRGASSPRSPETAPHTGIFDPPPNEDVVAEEESTVTTTEAPGDHVASSSSSAVVPSASPSLDNTHDAPPALSVITPETAASETSSTLAVSPSAPAPPSAQHQQPPPPSTPPTQAHASPPLSSTPVAAQKASSSASDVTQLLRFQQQLAEEMTRVSELEASNTALRAQVTSLRAELDSARAQLASSSLSAGDAATLIEKLGREKERNKAVLVERNKLMEQLSVLKEELEDHRTKSADLGRVVEEQEVSRLHINKMESEKEQFVTQIMELREELQAVKEAKEGLSRQLDEFERTHDSAVLQMKESTSSELEYATREVERLKGALRSSTVEYEDRITELENGLSQANRRAHMAESRLSDMERNSVGSLHDLRRELADLQQRTSVLTGDLGASRHAYEELQAKYTNLQRERHSDGERQSGESAALRAAKDNCLSLEEHVATLKQELVRTQRELESTRWQVDSLKATNTHLSASLETARQAANTSRAPGESAVTTPLERSLSLNAPPHSASLSLTPGPYAAPQAVAAALAVPNPFLPTHRAPMGGSLEGKARGRLEKEVVRQTMEISRLRQVEAEHAKLKQSHDALRVEYDLVLQMYGQMEEELQEVRRSGPSDEKGAAALPPAPAVVASSTLEQSPPLALAEETELEENADAEPK